MKVEYLKDFLTLVKLGNYAAAADALYISTSALSRHIMMLENEIGTKLFNREWRKISLTTVGSLLIPFAERMVEEHNKFFDILAKEKGITPSLTIGFSRSIVQYGMMDKLVKFRKENPSVSIVLTENNPYDLLSLVKKNDCNFILTYNYNIFNDDELQSIEIAKDTMAVALPSDHYLANKEKICLEDLKSEYFILHKKSGESYKHSMQLFDAAGYKPNVMAHVESGEYILELVAKGGCISFVEKERFMGVYPEKIKVVDLFPPVEKRIALIFKKRELDPLETYFLEFAKTSLKVK